MVQPNLIHPIDIVFSRINKGSTFYDNDAKEPIQQAVRYTSFTIKGQVNWQDTEKAEYEREGVVVGKLGYVLLRKVDMVAASFTPQIGDAITSIGGVTTKVYVNSVDWKGHYPDQSGPTLLKAHFTDRAPSRNV